MDRVINVRITVTRYSPPRRDHRCCPAVPLSLRLKRESELQALFLCSNAGAVRQLIRLLQRGTLDFVNDLVAMGLRNMHARCHDIGGGLLHIYIYIYIYIYICVCVCVCVCVCICINIYI